MRPDLHFNTAAVLLSPGRGVFPLAVPAGPSLKNTQLSPLPPVRALLLAQGAWLPAERERERESLDDGRVWASLRNIFHKLDSSQRTLEIIDTGTART